ncbi:MAG: CapA family protein [Patescibacteria group bacterium]
MAQPPAQPRPSSFFRQLSAPSQAALVTVTAITILMVSSFSWFAARGGLTAPVVASGAVHTNQTSEEPGSAGTVLGATTATPPTTTLVAVGDIMLSRVVEQKIIKQHDWSYPFRTTRNLTSAGDITFGNLESPLIAGPIVQTGSMVFRADPRSAEGLRYGGFDVLSLANNHMKNKGTAGIQQTIATLDQLKMFHVGAGATDVAARAPAIIIRNGLKFGFLAYLDTSFTPASYIATATLSGSPALDVTQMVRDVEALRKKVDVVIVSMHAGTEYAAKPNDRQIRFAHAAIDHGARLVIGHHPHVVQPRERYRDGYILYSLGNFVFDQMWSEPTRQGAIATVTFTGTRVSAVSLSPVKIMNYAQPQPLTGAEGKAVLQRMVEFTF